MTGTEPAAVIKASLTADQVARAYGFKPNRAGFIVCPFHSGDHSASLKLYPGNRGWCCFGCHAGGTVIDFVMRLFGISFQEAIARLNQDFGLGLGDFKPDAKAHSEAIRARLREQAIEERKKKIWWSTCRLYRFYCRILVTHRPVLDENGNPPQDLHPLYVEALSMAPYLECWLNDNL